MVNKANVLRVADAIENAELVKRGIGFNMSNYIAPAGAPVDGLGPDMSGHGCGTVACIAGTACALMHPRTRAHTLVKKSSGWELCPFDEAGEYLGLSMEDAEDLFIPGNEDINSITPAHAVAVLRHLAETGEVDWSVQPALLKATGGEA